MGDMPASLRESLEHSQTEYKMLGKCGLKVSVPILGAMSFGHPDWQPWVLDEEKVFIRSRTTTSQMTYLSDD